MRLKYEPSSEPLHISAYLGPDGAEEEALAEDVHREEAHQVPETLIIYKLSSRNLLHRTIFISNIKVNVW